MKKIRYALEAIALHLLYGVFWILPLDWASWLGGKLGELIGPFTKGHVVAANNLRTIFADKDEWQRTTILKNVWNHFGRIIAEYPHLEKIGKERISVQNKQVLEKTLDQDTAAIFATGHIGNWETNAAYLITQYHRPLHLTYRALNNLANDRLLYQARTMKGKIPAYPKHKKSSFDLMRAIKNKQFVGFMIDQKFNEGIEVPFFKRPAMTNPIFVQLAQKQNVPIIMAKAIRTKGANFEIEISCSFSCGSTL